MASTDRKNALTSDGSFWTSDAVSDDTVLTIGPVGDPNSIYTVDGIDTITFTDIDHHPLVLHDPDTADEYDVLQELKDTKRKLEAMETLIDKLLENARLDTSVAEALDKHEMLKRLSGDL
jgi:hypothetical protein